MRPDQRTEEPNLLDELREQLQACLVDAFAVKPEVARQFAAGFVSAFAARCGGMTLYVPQRDRSAIKEVVLQAVASGASPREAARQFEVSEKTVRRWMREQA